MFVILTILVEFFDGQGSSSKSREYMKVGELLNLVSDYLVEAGENMEPEEEEKTREIKKWLDENLTEKIIEEWKDNQVSEAENDLLLMAHIRVSLVKQYPGEDVAYLEMISEEYYNESVAGEEA